MGVEVCGGWVSQATTPLNRLSAYTRLGLHFHVICITQGETLGCGLAMPEVGIT